jgi:hypothetical protein
LEHLEMSCRDPRLLTTQQRRALALHERLILRRHRQVGALLRDIASFGSLKKEMASKDREYWIGCAMRHPGFKVTELSDALARQQLTHKV